MRLPVKVYQLIFGEENHGFLFMSYDENRPVEGDRYELVWAADIDVYPDEDTNDILNRLYEELNIGDKPWCYVGHSMSVSDIIVLSYDDGDKIAYVDSFGFKMLDSFECSNISERLQPMIRCIICEPGEEPEVIYIPDTLETKQRIVGGLIEMACPPYHKDTAVIICNEEGKMLEGFEPNRGIRDENGNVYDVIFGTFLIVDAPVDSEDFGSLSDEQVEAYTEMYSWKNRGWL